MTGPSIASHTGSGAGASWPQRLLRTLFAGLLAASSLGKLADLPGFVAIVDTYGALPAPLVPVAAGSLAAGELLLAAWLASGRGRSQSASALVCLHVVYLAWVATAWMRGRPIDNCGCFGVFLARPLTGWTVVEDALLVAAAVWLWRAARSTEQAAAESKALAPVPTPPGAA